MKYDATLTSGMNDRGMFIAQTSRSERPAVPMEKKNKEKIAYSYGNQRLLHFCDRVCFTGRDGSGDGL